MPKKPPPEHGRTQVSVSTIISQMSDNDEAKERYRTGWDYLKARGLTEGAIDIMAVDTLTADVRITAVFMARVLEDDIDFSIRDICAESKASLADYMRWEQNPVGKYAKRIDHKLAQERMRGQTRMVLRKISEWVQKGDKKAAEMYLRATGQYDGSGVHPDGVSVTVVEKYLTPSPTPSNVNVQNPTPASEMDLATLRAKATFHEGKGIKPTNAPVRKLGTNLEKRIENNYGRPHWEKTAQAELDAQKDEDA